MLGDTTRMQTTAPSEAPPESEHSERNDRTGSTSMTRATSEDPSSGVVETPMSETLQQATRRPKTSCHGWLDSLFSDLYTDLSALDAWEFERLPDRWHGCNHHSWRRWR